MKKIKDYPTKTFTVIIVQENHFRITQIILNNNNLKFKIIEDDHQLKEIHKISHKTDVVDH